MLNAFMAQGKAPDWTEIVNKPGPRPKPDTGTPDEIAADVIKRAGIKLIS